MQSIKRRIPKGARSGGYIPVLDKALRGGYSKFDKHQLGLITAQQAMDELGLKYNTLRRWEEAGLNAINHQWKTRAKSITVSVIF